MANESNPFSPFSVFNYRKILLPMIKGENKEEQEEEEEEEEEEEGEQQQPDSTDPIDKRQLIKKFFQKVNDLFPLLPGTTLDSIVVQFYQLKKEIINCDPNWKFMTSDFRYLADILPLLDAIHIGSEENIADVTRNVKICQRLSCTTRIWKQEKSLGSLDVENWVDFLYPQPQDSGAVSRHGQS
jgi:hypothetical protein